MPRQFQLASMVLALVTSAALGQDPRRDMAALTKGFASATIPTAAQLVGNWILVTNVNTEQFLSGRDGPDQVRTDSAGVRDSTGNPYWTLEFRSGRGGGMTLTSRAAFVGEYSPPYAFDSKGEFTFVQDYGGDSGYRYRCRMPSTHALICLEAHPGHGVEFRRLASKR
jgi:hypothetical protein